MHLASGSETEGEGGLRALGLWAAPLAVLVAVWVWMAFSSGGYQPRHWLPGSLVLGLFGLVASLLVLYPRRPRQLSLAVLACFTIYAIWVAFSGIWALSSSLAWLEAARTFSYLLLFALALVFLTHRGARIVFRYLLLLASLVIVILALVRVWSAHDLAPLFLGNRFFYPISYTNGAGALYLLAFWPLLWLAVDPRVKASVRGLALGVCTALLGLAFLTQSRGAFWSLGITVVITFIVSPARLKTLFFMLVPSLLMVWAVPHLNQYWTEGPTGLGGDVAGRTLLVLLVVAALIGMILALLEGWVNVTVRMRVVFGVVVLVAAAAALTYGSMTFAKDVGGPLGWVSRTYHQFVGDGRYPSGGELGSGESLDSRLLMVSSSGRIDLWKVAWVKFGDEPLAGIGAASFVFAFDQLQARDFGSVVQPHSWELQVLSETGVIGAVFGFGGVALLLGGLLWPRCAASWLHARRTWVRRRRQAAAGQDSEGTSSPPAERVSRWGSEPRDYGWEMALFVGILYFLIHGSVEWIWQIAGVAIPVLLLAAAALSEVDARAGAMWPRLAAWAGRHGGIHHDRTSQGAIKQSGSDPLTTEPGESAPLATGVADGAATHNPHEGFETPDEAGAPADGTGGYEPFPMATRRTALYDARRRRREHRARRSQRSREALIPPGPLSHAFRVFLAVLSLLILVGAGLPYLSLSLQDTALGNAVSDPELALARAKLASRLQPGDAGPFQTRAFIYQQPARAAAASTEADRGGAVLDNLALALSSQGEAILREPADWTARYSAAVSTLNLLFASDAVGGRPAVESEQTIIGLHDWSALNPVVGSPAAVVAAPGEAKGSLANTALEKGVAGHFRNLSREELLILADKYLSEAHERYPESRQVNAAVTYLETLRSQ